MNTTTKVAVAAVVAGGAVYLATREAKAAPKKSTTKQVTGTGTGELPNVNDPDPDPDPEPDYMVPPYPTLQVGGEAASVEQVYSAWAANEAATDAGSIQAGIIDAEFLTDSLADRAFQANYPTWVTGEGVYPRLSPTWVQWNDAWQRMRDMMAPLVASTLAGYGVA
jgi:hypothetical protein